MKTFSNEFVHSYETYSFGYCNYALREKNDKLSDIYDAGYLPYSGKLDVKDTFYMARSARVNLSKFTLSSENRRVARKFDTELTRIVTTIEEFDYKDKTFLSFCVNYFKKRHGPKIMPKERLLTILKMGLVSHVVTYTHDDEVVAYVLEVRDKDMTHFWFSFYDIAYVYQSLGMWLMLDCARETKRENKEYFYIGTVYDEKAIYKTNFRSLEYWNGHEWIADIKHLKQISHSDSDRSVGHIVELDKKEL